LIEAVVSRFEGESPPKVVDRPPAEAAPPEPSVDEQREPPPLEDLSSERRPSDVAEDSDASTRIAVSGTVILPPGTSATQPLVVVLYGLRAGQDLPFRGELRGTPALEKDRASAGADGSFALTMPMHLERAWVELASSGLVLRDAVEIADCTTPAPLVLAPELASALCIHFAPSAETQHDPSLLAGRPFTITEWRSNGAKTRAARSHVARIAPGESVLFEGLLADSEILVPRYGNDVAPFAPMERAGILLEAGRTIDVELALLDGFVVAGLVVDDLGAPIADARVSVRWGPGTNWADWVCDSTESGDDGRFVLAGLGDRPHEIRAEKAGYASLRKTPGSLHDDASFRDLELRLERVP
jgi:hypothetical protein